MVSVGLIILLSLSVLITSEIVKTRHEGVEWPNNLLEDNILLKQEDVAIKRESIREKRQMRSSASHRWPGGVVPFEFLPSVEDVYRRMYRKAMDHIMKRTCVRFVEDKNATDRIQMGMHDGICQSFVGRVGGAQALRMDDKCYHKGNFIHEMMHALGSNHAQERYDRDKYLNVTTDDIFYNRIYLSNVSYNVIPFEYASDMTYEAAPGYQPIDPQYLASMGLRFITFYDMLAISIHYNCHLKCPKQLKCERGGYTNPSNCSECVCPDGFGGLLCEGAPKEFTKRLKAEMEWKEHSIEFGFRTFNDWFQFEKMTFSIEAPNDKTIQVQVLDMSFTCAETKCKWNHFEIKYLGDPRVTNPIICCKDTQKWNELITSKLNPTPIILRTRFSFCSLKFRYRFINESLSALPRTNNTYDSFEYPA